MAELCDRCGVRLCARVTRGETEVLNLREIDHRGPPPEAPQPRRGR
jgi:hypothetical protein